jgi:hypothetical protein
MAAAGGTDQHATKKRLFGNEIAGYEKQQNDASWLVSSRAVSY